VVEQKSQTGATIALATCWMARGRLHAAQLAKAFNATTEPIPSRPRTNPIGLASSVPMTMWFMFRANPVITTMVTCARIKPTKAHMMRKWIERPICRLAGNFGYHLNRLVKAGDIADPVSIARGARTNTAPKYASCWSAL
jgi:hypothetical protein